VAAGLAFREARFHGRFEEELLRLGAVDCAGSHEPAEGGAGAEGSAGSSR
jgi:hypothetical protein